MITYFHTSAVVFVTGDCDLAAAARAVGMATALSTT